LLFEVNDESAKSNQILIFSYAPASLYALHAIDDDTKYKIFCSPGKKMSVIILTTL